MCMRVYMKNVHIVIYVCTYMYVDRGLQTRHMSSSLQAASAAICLHCPSGTFANSAEGLQLPAEASTCKSLEDQLFEERLRRNP